MTRRRRDVRERLVSPERIGIGRDDDPDASDPLRPSDYSGVSPHPAEDPDSVDHLASLRHAERRFLQLHPRAPAPGWFGAENVTTGASGDFQQVSNTARMMVEQMGFSEKIGQIALKTGGGQSFLGNDAGRAADYSQTTANLVDAEVKDLVEKAYRRAKDLVEENIDCLHAVADVLLDKENIDGDEFEKIMLAAKARLYLKEDNEAIEVPFKTA